MSFRIDPIFYATGVQALLDPSFRVEGLIPTAIGSIYYSNTTLNGPFGLGRLSDLDQFLALDASGRVVFLDEDNLSATFERAPVKNGLPSLCNTARRLLLYPQDDGSYIVREGWLARHFSRGSNDTWHLAKIEDRNGTAVCFERNSSGRLDALTTPEHLRVEFRYENDLRTSAHLFGTDGSERKIMTWAYDGQRRMIQAESCYQAVARYEYDAQHRLVLAQTSDGYATRREYDDTSRVVAVHTNGPYDGDRYVYDNENRVTTYLPGGDSAKAIKYYRDGHDLIVKVVDALGGITEIRRASNGDLIAEINGEGGSTRYAYDENGNVAAKTDPEGRTSRVRWDRDRLVECVTDGEDGAWDYSRDDNGNLIAVRDPVGFRTDLVNNAAGQPTSIMRHDGLIERRRYDDHHRLSETIDFRGGRTSLEHDAFGRVVVVTDPMGACTRLRYDDTHGTDFWSPAQVEQPDGTIVSVATSGRGLVTVVTDGEGHLHGFRKGPCGVLTEIEGAKGAKVHYVYDGLLRLEKVVNQNGRTWTFERDVAGRLVRACDIDGLAIEYAYDNANRCIETRYADGTRIHHAYDRSGLLVRDEVHEPGRPEPSITTFRYDGRGLVAAAENGEASVRFERDKIGRILVEEINGRRVEKAFDCCGNQTSRRVGESLTTYDYDPMGGLRKLTVGRHDPLEFTRDMSGRETGRRHPRGFRLDQIWDERGRLIHQHVPDASASRPSGGLTNAVDRTYRWSRNSLPRSIVDSGWGTVSYEYDANGQVVLARFGDDGTERYWYDAALNVTASAGRVGGAAPATSMPSGDVRVEWSTTPGGRVTTARGPQGEQVTLVCDVRGRVVERTVMAGGASSRTWRYRWNGRDRLIESVTPEGEHWSYGYDPFARRVRKTNIGGDARALSEGFVYIWERDRLCQEAKIVKGVPDWANAVTWNFEPSTFVPLAYEEDDDLLNIVTDHLGTPRELFADSGKLLLAAEHHVWGASRRSFGENKPIRQAESEKSTEGAYAFRTGFQGQFADPGTGLKYNHFRYYDPLTSQYASTDPAGILGGLRPHGYVHSPTIWVDPAGLYGVYLFETTLNNCYVGKGEPDRMMASMNYRTKAPPSEIKRCLYTNTDADAAKAGVDPNTYGALVENRLLSPSGYGATASPDWFNTQFSGQSAFAAATPAQQAAATATAADIQGTFGPCP